MDIVDVLFGLRCRIGELLALDWTKVDDAAGSLAIEGTVIRVPAQGLIVAREIADYPGHERISMTQDVYMSRKANGANAAAAPDRLGPTETGDRGDGSSRVGRP